MNAKASKTNRECPSRIKGKLEISKRRSGVFIGGDPAGLRSLARLLNWLADVDQESHPTMPDGEREHVHLYGGDPAHPASSLTEFSVLTELCRLDAKGTGDFPPKYRESAQNQRGRRKATLRKKRAVNKPKKNG